MNFLQQQAKFDRFVQEYSHERPHLFAAQNVGVREIADNVWLAGFMHYDLGFFDVQECRVECAPNPFGAKEIARGPRPRIPGALGTVAA